MPPLPGIVALTVTKGFFPIVIRLEPEVRLGLTVKADGGWLRVLDVVADSPLERWNQEAAHEEEEQIRVNDWLVQVNHCKPDRSSGTADNLLFELRQGFSSFREFFFVFFRDTITNGRAAS